MALLRTGRHRWTRRAMREHNKSQERQIVELVTRIVELEAQVAAANARLEEADVRRVTETAACVRHVPESSAEQTQTIPALRDVAARLGAGDYLDDTDATWRVTYASAVLETQPLPQAETPPVMPLWAALGGAGRG